MRKFALTLLQTSEIEQEIIGHQAQNRVDYNHL
jgi:hypothetical protein